MRRNEACGYLVWYLDNVDPSTQDSKSVAI